MKVVLICPSNMLYMPYVKNYIMILNEYKIDYDVINWDRFSIEEESGSRYRDQKNGHRRNIFDYYGFKKFIVNNLNSTHYDKVVVFGIQLAFFLKNVLEKRFKRNYIIDIRDYNKVIRYFNIKNLINNSSFTVLSSSGFKEWLPKTERYIINHNTRISNLDDLEESSINLNKPNKIKVAYIGSLRDYTINTKFISSLKGSSRIDLYFHGEGTINNHLKEYLNTHGIKNVYISGRYKKEDEDSLYKKNDLINILIPNNDVNSKTLLPNRLYNSVINGKPVIAYEGTFLAEQVKKYELGLVVDSFNEVEDKLINYYNSFNSQRYKKAQRSFMGNVIKENGLFREYLIDFVNGR